MEVEKLMTRGARSCAPDDTANRAAQIMWENDCGVVPVVEASGKVVAMITDRDICMAAYHQGKRLAEIVISSAASRSVFTIHEDDDVAKAEALMQEHQIRRIPVVDRNERLVGVLAMADIARCLQGATPIGGDGVTHQEVARTLTAVCQPNQPAETSGTARQHAA